MHPCTHPHLYTQGCAPHAAAAHPVHPQHIPPYSTPITWVASRRLSADDPERSLQFWENSRHTAAARLAEANEKATARAAAGLPDRVHSSMWHQHSTVEQTCTNSPPAGTETLPEPESRQELQPEPEPEPEPELQPSTLSVVAAAAAHPPVFSAEVSRAAAQYRAERQRHALSVPHVSLCSQPASLTTQ
jgi:hypothetical protein